MLSIKKLPGEEALCKCKVSFGYDWRILCVVNHWRNVSEGSRWCQCDFWKQFPKRPGVCSGNSLARLPIFKRNCSYFSWYWAGISFKKFFQDFKKPCHVCLFFFQSPGCYVSAGWVIFSLFWKCHTSWLDMSWYQSYQNVYGNGANCSPFEHGEPLRKLVWCIKSGEIIAFCFTNHCFFWVFFAFLFDCIQFWLHIFTGY